MKVLHVETGQHLYGGAQQVAYLMAGLKEQHVECILCCPNGAAIGKEAGKTGIKVRYTKKAGDLSLTFFRQLKKIIKEESPDLIHLHSRRGADILGGIAAKQCKVPAILSRRVDNPEKHFFVKWKYKLYTHVITISEAIMNVLLSEGVPREKMTCVLSSVDIKKYQQPAPRKEFLKRFQLTENSLCIGMAAQMIERKGHATLFKALPDIVGKFPDIQVLIFGQGPLEAELKTLSSELKLEPHIKFEGFCEDLERWLGNLDILVHPAYKEGLGVALLQAASAGIPIIGGNAGGIPEIVHHEKNGLLFEPGNSDQLKAGLNQLLSNADLRKAYGENGQILVEENFSIDKMVSGNLNIYRNILKQGVTEQANDH